MNYQRPDHEEPLPPTSYDEMNREYGGTADGRSEMMEEPGRKNEIGVDQGRNEDVSAPNDDMRRHETEEQIQREREDALKKKAEEERKKREIMAKIKAEEERQRLLVEENKRVEQERLSMEQAEKERQVEVRAEEERAGKEIPEKEKAVQENVDATTPVEEKAVEGQGAGDTTHIETVNSDAEGDESSDTLSNEIKPVQ